jgi:hypothetical protein
LALWSVRPAKKDVDRAIWSSKLKILESSINIRIQWKNFYKLMKYRGIYTYITMELGFISIFCHHYNLFGPHQNHYHRQTVFTIPLISIFISCERLNPYWTIITQVNNSCQHHDPP